MHKQTRFSFGKSFVEKYNYPDYLTVSEVNDQSESIYFSKTNKEEDYTVEYGKTKLRGAIVMNKHEYAEIMEKNGWVGSYSTSHKENGFYCIKKKRKRRFEIQT